MHFEALQGHCKQLRFAGLLIPAQRGQLPLAKLQVISKCLSKHSKNVFPPPQSFLSHLNILCVLYFKELLLKKKALVWKLLIARSSICFLFCKKPLVTEISLYFSWKREKTWQLRLCLPSFLKACITFIREKRN